MESLNLVNLIQAATMGVSLLGGLILWRKKQIRGIASLLPIFLPLLLSVLFGGLFMCFLPYGC